MTEREKWLETELKNADEALDKAIIERNRLAGIINEQSNTIIRLNRMIDGFVSRTLDMINALSEEKKR